MIANWMLSAMVFSSLCAIAALASDSALRAFRTPSRLVWVAAIIAGTTWPLIARFVLRPAPIDATAAGGTVSSTTIITASVPSLLDLLSGKWANIASLLDGPLLLAWLVGTALLLVQLSLAIRTLERIRRRASAHALDGEIVFVDDAVGPAVLGVLNPRIVVPTWLLSLDSELRRLVVRHEREHQRARDPALMWLSVAATTIAPWNAPLWWMARQLRLAMEIDCDARTLRHTLDHSQYAKLLLLIAGRNSSTQLALMLSPPSGPSHISRRISAMRKQPVRGRFAVVSTSVFIAALAVAAACSNRIAANLSSPNPNAEPQTSVTRAQPEKSAATVSETDTSYFDLQVNRPATMQPGTKGPDYPAALRAARVSGSVLAQYVVNADGSIDVPTLKILKATNSEFADAVREALPAIRYLPATVNGKMVRQLVQAPFAFALGGEDRSARAEMGIKGQTQILPPGSSAAPDRPYFDFQVKRPAQALPGVKGPTYPPELRANKTEGNVLVQIVVDAEGVPEMSSLKVLKSDHDDFSAAVKAALAEMRFEPAQVKGKNVKQLVQLPFMFRVPQD